VLFLEKLVQECAFMGAIEKTIQRIVNNHKAETEVHSKKVDISSNDSEEEEENWKENSNNFNDS
jgi:hypothetical protein